MTQIENAREGIITARMEAVARAEARAPEYVRGCVSAGTVVILANSHRPPEFGVGVGLGLRTKVNANIGASPDHVNVDDEIEKLRVAVDAGADAVMDLSVCGTATEILQTILRESSVPVGTVPLYQAAADAVSSGKAVVDMTEEEILAAFESHAEIGVDFFVVHAAITRESIARMRNEGRLTKIISRGGAFAAEWMVRNDAENPLYTRFDEILGIAKARDVTISLGDAMRPGCLADATDRGQIQELLIQGELADRARRAGVQVMIEGPGHVPINEIEANVVLQKRVCGGAPFYVLGPLVTDIAPGYDHITAAIGGAVAAAAGADFLCYVTPCEHLALPAAEDVHAGVMACRIAAHAGDIAKGVPGATDWDDSMARSRRAREWAEQIKTAIDPELAAELRSRGASSVAADICTMCGEYCPMKGVETYL